MATDTDIEEVLIDLSEAYPDWKPPSVIATFTQYKQALRNYSKGTLQRAARRCMDSCVFFPKIAELKKAVYELPPEGTYQADNAKDLVFVPPPPEVKEAIEGLIAKWTACGYTSPARRKANRARAAKMFS
jgi:hypothetical protein